MKRQILSGVGIMLFALGLIATRADAYPVTIYIEAEVDTVDDSGNYLEGKINVGDIITGYYLFDSETPDQDWLWGESSPTVGRYHHFNAPYGIFLTVGGFDFQTNHANVNFLIEIINDSISGGLHDGYIVRSYNNLQLSNGTAVDHISWILTDFSATALSSDALPITPPVLTDWQSNHLRLEGAKQNLFLVDAHVTSAIPEPTTILLFSLGSLLLRKRK